MEIIKIISLIFCMILPRFTIKNSESKLILLMGPTRAGKSCFINTITGKDMSIVGDDSGESTTKVYEIYDSEIDGFPDNERFKLIDTMGLDDSDESGFGDPIILASIIHNLKKEMENSSISLQSIYLFESLTNDANQIFKTIKKLKAVFGDDIVDNVIVVFSKNPKPNIKRMASLKHMIASEGVQKYIHWLSGCGTNALSDDYYVQMEDLYGFTLNKDSISALKMKGIVDDLIAEGKLFFEQISIFGKYNKYYNYASLALSMMQIMNIPLLVLSNVAAYGIEKYYLNSNPDEQFLLSIAIEERIKTHFKKE